MYPEERNEWSAYVDWIRKTGQELPVALTRNTTWGAWINAVESYRDYIEVRMTDLLRRNTELVEINRELTAKISQTTISED